MPFRITTDVGNDTREHVVYTKQEIDSGRFFGNMDRRSRRLLDGDTSRISAGLSDAQDDIDELNNVKLPDLDDILDDLETKMSDLESSLSDLGTSLTDLDGYLGDLDNRLDTQETKMSDLETSLTNAGYALDSLGSDLDTLDGELDTLDGYFDDPSTIPSSYTFFEGIVTEQAWIDALVANQAWLDELFVNDAYADRITANDIVTDSLTSNEIDTEELAASTAWIDEVIANNAWIDTITANNLWTDELTANEIDAGTITSNEINVSELIASTVWANEFVANEGYVDELIANNVFANKITANEISVDNLQAISVTTGNLDIDGSITITSSGEITNTNGDFTIDSTGFSILQQSTFNRESAYSIEDSSGNVFGSLWGQTSPDRIILDGQGNRVDIHSTDRVRIGEPLRYLEVNNDGIEIDGVIYPNNVNQITISGTGNTIAPNSRVVAIDASDGSEIDQISPSFTPRDGMRITLININSVSSRFYLISQFDGGTGANIAIQSSAANGTTIEVFEDSAKTLVYYNGLWYAEGDYGQ